MAFQFLPPVIAMFFGGLASMAMFGAGYGDILRRFFHNSVQGSLEDVGSALREFGKGAIDEDTFYSIMAQNGFKRQFAERLLKANPDQLQPTEIIRLWFLHKDEDDQPFPVNPDWLKKRLSQAGIDTEITNEIIEANRPIPTIDDIIRFSARESFEPEAVAQGKLLEGIPPVYIKEAKRRGLNQQETEWYWSSHWEVPGIQSAFEMFQRLFDHPDPEVKFDESDLDIFFNVADIAPGYRKRLREIAYIPLGRVDIRRAWSVGVFSKFDNPRQALVRAYREIGFNAEDAEFHADFTEKLAQQSQRDLTKALILEFWREGVYEDDRDQKAIEELTQIGYTKEDSQDIIKLESLKEITQDEQARIDNIKTAFLNGAITTANQIRTDLANIGLASSRIDKLTNQFIKERATRQTKLTRSQLEQMFRSKIIDEKTFREALRVDNYRDEDIDRIVALQTKPDSDIIKRPNVDTVVTWFEQQIINENQYVSKMQSIGVPSDEIILYAVSKGLTLSDPTVSSLLQ